MAGQRDRQMDGWINNDKDGLPRVEKLKITLSNTGR